MNLKNVKRNAMIFTMAASFILPQLPHMSLAKPGSGTGVNVTTIDLFGDDDTSDTGLGETSPTIPKNNNSNGNNNIGNGNNKQNNIPGVRPQPNSIKMNVARVPQPYQCPLFENRPHADLIEAIEKLNAEVKASPECTGSPSAQALQENGEAIKKSIGILQGIMNTQDAMTVNTNQIDISMTDALKAIANMGDIVNNNNFLNSKCGKETMSSGKMILAINDVINGLAPYALFAVSMNAALAPALPYVLGGAVATSAISAVSKMIDSKTLKMDKPEHRKALLQNTCQFTKVAKKVRFMQLAQSGKIDKITQELEKNVDLYNATFSNPSSELSGLLNYRATSMASSGGLEKQLLRDRTDLNAIEEQAKSKDDVMVCTLSNELAQWAQDEMSFPNSVFANLEAVTAQSDRAQKLQVATMKALHLNSLRQISQFARNAYDNEKALKSCAQVGRSWLAAIRQALNATSTTLEKSKKELESELSRSPEYRQWQTQYNRIQAEKVTIKRVEKAMQELAKDNSIIDRSELAQSMVTLKAGLFGSRSSWDFGTPPVLSWINHTKAMHDQAISAFVESLKAIREGSFSLTTTGRDGLTRKPGVSPYMDAKVQIESLRAAENLSNLNLQQLPLGSREHEIMCQQLESAWLDWSAAIDHLGAVQFFCDMIDPVLDAKMDFSIIKTCRGISQLNGQTSMKSLVGMAKDTLVTKGFQAQANLVGQKMKALECPVPAVSVMNQ